MRFSDSLVSSPKTPTYEQEEAFNSLEFSSGDHTTHGSMDDMFLEDLNPCLTLFAKSNSKEIGYASPRIRSNSRWIANMATLPTQ
ncbi:hypothetical protein L2E82_10476 [Cichorium intybus]|uniref:Uncharacterized protein n=1 Tax=Cichorium intybus TaxID=13427 RepID=A0ACB9GAP9_CICIN|nr:hypothetical protein L2E82_10476 [Cichorium intybus]